MRGVASPEACGASGQLKPASVIKSVACPLMTPDFFDLVAGAGIFAGCLAAATREILLIAGPPSHTRLAHEQNAAAMLFARFLKRCRESTPRSARDGWPADESLISQGRCDLGLLRRRRKASDRQGYHTAQMQAAADRGAGMMFYHYGVEPPDKSLHKEFLDWTGGYFELNYSVNPIFEADFASLPKHPITRGVTPFKLKDEWYYNMRFREDMKGITQILVATPPASSLSRPDGPHEGNPDVRTKVGQPQCMMWAYERPDGGRGVGIHRRPLPHEPGRRQFPQTGAECTGVGRQRRGSGKWRAFACHAGGFDAEPRSGKEAVTASPGRGSVEAVRSSELRIPIGSKINIIKC